jgi:eukaryotic-like serine/threonine-protein kinase
MLFDAILVAVRSVSDAAAGTFAKEAETAADRRRLLTEAGILTAVAHPGVVRLLSTEGDPPETLILELVEGTDLARAGINSVEVLAGIGAAVATTLADIHDLGVVHGAIDPSHILIDQQGRAVLCGFGAASRPPTRAELIELAEDDTAALAGVLVSRLPSSADARLRAALRRAAGRRGRSRRLDARWLARELIRRTPGARLGGPGSGPHSAEATPPLRPAMTPSRRRVRPVLVVGAAISVGTVLAVVAAGPGTSGRRSAAPGKACPAVDRSCRPVAWPGGVIVTEAGRFRVSAPPGSLVVLGRWDCSGQALPAIAELPTGDIWLFDSWPGPGRTSSARLVARVGAVSGLAVIPGKTGCDLLRISETGRRPITVRPVRA